MVKVAVGSDLHTEFHWPHMPDPDTDLLLLAGDTGTNTSQTRWFEDLDRLRPNTWRLDIPGNHWGYDKTPWEECEQTLVSDAYGLKIVGATLWTDFNLYGDPQRAKEHAHLGMNDYRTYIRPDRQWLEPHHTEEWNRQHIEFLRQFGKAADIIMTHHAPSSKSIAPEFIHDYQLNPCFVSNLDDLVKELKPRLWIHGHTHTSCEYIISDGLLATTTVICNPRGYPGENKDWDWRYLDIDVQP